jgi:hypothetical protein
MASGMVVGVLTAGVAVVAIAATGGIHLDGPFGTETKHRDQSALLQDLRDVSRYEAAEGQFQVIVDLEHDTRFLPSWLSGDRTTFIAEGDVPATVDFSTLGEGAVVASEDGTTASITLPEPTIGEPRIDVDNSRVMSEDKGIVDRVNDLMSGESSHDQELYQAAEAKLARAAEQSDLVERAEANTTTMLTGMLEGLGYDDVQVTFEDPGASA